MYKIVIYLLIFGLFYLILNHFILSTKEGLDNNCTTSAEGGCKNVAVEKNNQAARNLGRYDGFVDAKRVLESENRVETLENENRVESEFEH